MEARLEAISVSKQRLGGVCNYFLVDWIGFSMPIRIQCQCGHSLQVPDQLAGKSGKCPKCSNVIKIPVPSGGSSKPAAPEGTATKAASAKPGAGSKAPSASAPKPTAKAAVKQAAPAAKAGLDDLFDQVGLVKKTGTFCPGCDAPMQPGTALCVKCGFNLETGQKLAGFETESSRQEFDNKHLNEAAKMMKREDVLESRMRNAGMPWWALFCMLLVGALVVLYGVVMVDGYQTGFKGEDTFRGKVQRLPFLVSISSLFALNCLLVGFFAHFAVVAQGFRQKAAHGWGCLLVPLYSPIYGLTQFKQIRGTVIAYCLRFSSALPQSSLLR